MAILYGALMLPGLTSLGPFDVRSFCPQTRVADFDPEGNSSARLLPKSAMKTLPAASVFTSAGAESVFADENGAIPVFAVDVDKSDCPMTFFAAAPKPTPAGKTSTRLSPESATYKFPLLSSAMPSGPAILDAV